MTATGQTADRDEVAFTDDEIAEILNGQIVEKDGYRFSHSGVYDEQDVDWHSFKPTWEKLRDGEREKVVWSDVVGTFADDDDELFTEQDKELMAEAQREHATREMTTIPDSDREVIHMEYTVDVSGMDPDDREAIGQLADLYEDCFREVTEKNRDYGFSFLHTGQKLAETDAIPFDDPVRAQAFGLLTRLGDKRERLIENVYGNGDAAVSDPPATTAMEAANYYLFIAFVLGNPELAEEL